MGTAALVRRRHADCRVAASAPDCHGKDVEVVCHVLSSRASTGPETLRVVAVSQLSIRRSAARLITQAPETTIEYGPGTFILRFVAALVIAHALFRNRELARRILLGAARSGFAAFQMAGTAAMLASLWRSFSSEKSSRRQREIAGRRSCRGLQLWLSRSWWRDLRGTPRDGVGIRAVAGKGDRRFLHLYSDDRHLAEAVSESG